MTKSDILALLLEYIDALDEKETILQQAETQQVLTMDESCLTLARLIAGLKGDIVKESAKAAGLGNVYKIATKLIKNVAGNAQLAGSITQDGTQYYCDGYTAIKLNEPLDIPPAPRPLLRVAELFANSIHCTEPLALPSLADLKAHIKTQKAIKKAKKEKYKTVLYTFGDNLPTVNAEYLADIMTAFPDAEALRNDKTLLTPIYFTGDKRGEALLQPIRVSNQ